MKNAKLITMLLIALAASAFYTQRRVATVVVLEEKEEFAIYSALIQGLPNPCVVKKLISQSCLPEDSVDFIAAELEDVPIWVIRELARGGPTVNVPEGLPCKYLAGEFKDYETLHQQYGKSDLLQLSKIVAFSGGRRAALCASTFRGYLSGEAKIYILVLTNEGWEVQRSVLYLVS